MGKRPLLYLAGGFVLGEVLGLQCMMAVQILLPAAAVVLACMGLGAVGAGQVIFLPREKGYWWIGCISLFLLCGFCRGRQERHVWETEQALALDGVWREYTGKLRGLKDCGSQWEMLLALEEPMGGEPRRIFVYVDKGGIAWDGRTADMRPRLGMGLRVEGKLEAFGQARNPGQFGYRDYCRAQGISYRMSAGRCEAGDGPYDIFADGLWGARDWAGRILNQVADPADAGVFRAALLGDKTALDASIRELYQRNGIAHLLAISALHLSMISAAVYGMLRWTGLGYGVAGLAGGGLMVCYGVMTGASPSVVRALTMALCGYLAAFRGRTYDLLSALGLAGIVLLWDSPYQLTQAGTQLSFAAVLGIAAAGPVLGLPLMTLPVVLYHYFQTPVYGVFLNLIVVPLMGIVLASGAAGILLGAFSQAAGRFAAGSGHLVLLVYEVLCHFWECLPGANLVLGRPAGWQIGLYYGFFAVALMRARVMGARGKAEWKAEWKALPRTVLFSVILPMFLLPLPVRGLQVAFLDVGQGDGICLRTGSVTVLVDGGSSSEGAVGADCLEPYFKSQGICVVDYAVVSHGDWDHISGLEYLLQSGDGPRIRHLVLPGAGEGDEVYERLARLAFQKGVDVSWMRAGDCLESGRLQLTCLYPKALALPREDRNEHSLVLRCDYGEFHMLLTGDMSEEGERELLAQETGGLSGIQVLKIAHHGSRYSSCGPWLGRIQPTWAVVSYGEGNRYGHPSQEVMDALSGQGVTVYETAKTGAVQLRTDGKRISWECFLRGE